MTETKNYYTTSINGTDHTTFGGEIYNYDFDGYNSMGGIAARIASDIRFDKMCQTNYENRKRNMEYKKGMEK